MPEITPESQSARLRAQVEELMKDRVTPSIGEAIEQSENGSPHPAPLPQDSKPDPEKEAFKVFYGYLEDRFGPFLYKEGTSGFTTLSLKGRLDSDPPFTLDEKDGYRAYCPVVGNIPPDRQGTAFKVANLFNERHTRVKAQVAKKGEEQQTATLMITFPVFGDLEDDIFSTAAQECFTNIPYLYELWKNETGAAEGSVIPLTPSQNLETLTFPLLERVFHGLPLKFAYNKEEECINFSIANANNRIGSVRIRGYGETEQKNVLVVMMGKREEVPSAEWADALVYCNKFNGHSIKGHVVMDMNDTSGQAKIMYMSRTYLASGTNKEFLRNHLTEVISEASYFLEDAHSPWRFKTS